jgi:hypothetical protein
VCIKPIIIAIFLIAQHVKINYFITFIFLFFIHTTVKLKIIYSSLFNPPVGGTPAGGLIHRSLFRNSESRAFASAEAFSAGWRIRPPVKAAQRCAVGKPYACAEAPA